MNSVEKLSRLLGGPEHLSKRAPIASNRGMKVECTLTIGCPAQEIYRFWRQLENLPRVFRHLESVTQIGDLRSHWVARIFDNNKLEWDAEIIAEKENEMIAWRSLEGSEVASAGSVWFKPAPGNRGTVVDIVMKYDPPTGKLGIRLARVFGADLEEDIKRDFFRLRQLIETGEIATNQMRPNA